jgi:hypothetical protein
VGTEERFERIESGLAAVVEAQHSLTEAQRNVVEAQRGLVEAHRMSDAMLRELMQTIGSFADSVNARMKRIEDNLDLLIRALTTDRSNGKSSH